jgi:hypothetical protein
MIEAWLASTADSFWSLAGGPIAPPRDLAHVVSRQLPLSVVSLAHLSVTGVERWLTQRHVPYRFLCRDRALCGCIVAARGHGLLFLDADDAADERRFTAAHEIAHFLLDYDAPRRRALALFGESIRPVLDGERPPTAEERIDAVLSSLALGIYVDMMPRSAQGSIDQGSILRAEERADRLALELLAPAEQVLAQLPAVATQPLERMCMATEVLISVYGLPRQVARTYAAAVVRQPQPSTAEWLGF